MTIFVGPTFWHELEETGLDGLPIEIQDSGEVRFLAPLSPEEQAEFDALLAAHDPDAKVPGATLPPPPVRPQAKLIGPSFRSELIAAGLGNLPLGLCEDGTIIGLDQLTDEEFAAVTVVLAAHDPTRPAPMPVPESVFLSDFRAGVIASAGPERWKQVRAAVESLKNSDDPSALIVYERFEYANKAYRTTLHAGMPLLNALTSGLNLTAEEIDAALIFAEQIGATEEPEAALRLMPKTPA